MKKSFKKYEKAGLPGGPNELKRFTQGFIVSERGQWDYPGLPTAVPTPTGKITMKGVEDDLLGIDNLGNAQYMTPGNEYQFEGDMVYEIPQAKKGGSKMYPKKYSRNLMARNILFTKNPLFKKSKSVKNKIFDPNSPYFASGGEIISFDFDDTLSTDRGLQMAQSIPNEKYIISARAEVTPDMIERARAAGISEDRIFATGSDKAKIAKIKELGINRHIDNKQSVINKLGSAGQIFESGGALSPKDLDPATLEKYLSDLRYLENSIKKGYRNNKWYPHASIEGGANTIAYGHKLQPGESFSSGLTEQQARDLQKKDVLVHQTKAEKFVDNKYGKGTYDKLPQNSQMLLTDYAYNLGSLNKFPSFVEGVVKGDKNKMLKEYERRGLSERNKWTKNVINTTDFSKKSNNSSSYLSDFYDWFNDLWFNKQDGGELPEASYGYSVGNLIRKQDGGFILELDDNEIEEYRKGGYIIEDISIPSLTKARNGRQTTGIDPAFQAKAQQVANNLGVSLEDLLGIMRHESGLNPGAVNPYTNATGLIQFMPNTAKGLGTSIEALKNMSAIEQLDYVEKYFKPIAGKAKDIGDLYMYTFLPAAVGKDDNFVIGASGSSNKVFGINQNALYKQNKTFDADKKGYYTVGDVKNRISKFSGRPLAGSSDQSIPGFESSTTRTPGEKTVVKTTIIKDMQNDDWKPGKEEEQVDPRIEQLKTFTKIIEPSLQNINNIYAAAMQQKRFGGNTRMFQDGGMLIDASDEDINNYTNNGYIVEEVDEQDQLLNKPGYGAIGVSGSSPVPEYLQPSDVTWYGTPRQMVTAPEEVIYRSPITGRLQSGQYDPNANQEQLADAATNIRYADVAQGRAESTTPTEEIKLSDRVIKSGNYLKGLKSVKPIKGLARPQGEFYTKEEYEKFDKDKLEKSGYYPVQLKDGNYELIKKEDIADMIIERGITPQQLSTNYKIGDSKSISKDFKPVYDYAQQLQAQRVGPMIDELIYSGKSVDQAIKALVAKGEDTYEGIKQKYGEYAKTIKKDADKIYTETLEANKKKKQTEEQRLEDDLLIKNYLNQDTKGLSESQRQMFLNLALSQKETIDKLNSEIDKAQRDAAAGFGSGTRDATATQAYSSRNPYSEATATSQRLGQEKANAAYAADVAKYVITDPKLTEEDRKNILSDPNKFNEAAKAYNEFQNKELKKQFEADQMLAQAGRYKPQYQSGVASMIYPEMFFMGPGLGAAGKALTSGLDVLGRASAKSIPGLASIPGATIGNLLGAGFAADAVVNRLLPIPGQLQRGEYAEAATNALTGILDVGTAGLISPIYKGARSAASELGKFLGTEEGILSNLYKVPVESTGSLNKFILNKLKPVKPENQLQVFQGNSYVDELPKSYIDQKDINNSYFRQKSWLESDEYLKRRSAATGESPEIIAIDVKNILDRFKNLKIKSGKMLDPKAGGYYDPEKNLIVLNRNSSREEALFMLDHEIKHALSQVATSGNYKNYPVSKIGNKLTNLTQPAFNIYLRDPAEQQVRSLRMLDFIKGKYGIPEGQKLSIEDINRFADDVSSISGGIYADEFLKNYPDVLHHLIGMKQADQKLRFVPKNILKGKSPLKFENQGNLRQNILNQLNKTYMIPAAIVGAGALQQEQDGGMVMDLSDKEIDQYRKGGWIVEEID